MLTEQEKDIIKQTVPLLKEKGTEITSIFYPKMFKAHPELLNMFNQTNQSEHANFGSTSCNGRCG